MRFWLAALLLFTAVFAEDIVLPPVSPFPSAAKEIFSSGIPDILFLIDSQNGVTNGSWAGELAESLRGKIVFASIDRDNEESAHALEFFSAADGSDKAAVRIFNTEKRKQYWMSGDVNSETLSAWIKEYFEGNVAAHMKSETLGDDWNTKPTVTLVGSNFKEAAFDTEKDVFVMFHAPWCGHCKKLSPQWDELANSYSGNDKIVIAKLDATANDIDDGYADIQGFPTIRLYKSDDNSIHEYNGERSVEALQKFLEEHTGISSSSGKAPEESEDHDEL